MAKSPYPPRTCPECDKTVRITVAGGYSRHTDGKGDPCPKGHERVPLTELQLPPEKPSGVEEYAQPAPVSEVLPYAQPAKVNPAVKGAVPMDDLGQQITSTIKEIFRQYVNRTGRSAQKTLGPSQIGTPCDRRLAMHLLEMPPVNPGNDGWAAFVGTCIHSGFEKMMKLADAGQGRFVTELALQYPSEHVPHGTADLLDRVLLLVGDYKCQGTFALDKLKREGPDETYRVQLQCYAYGAAMRGERVEYVALIALPRDKASLDNLYVWTALYDPQVARDALARVDRIAKEVEQHRHENGEWAQPRDWEVAQQFPVKPDCTYCAYHQPNAKDLSNGGCNGRS